MGKLDKLLGAEVLLQVSKSHFLKCCQRKSNQHKWQTTFSHILELSFALPARDWVRVRFAPSTLQRSPSLPSKCWGTPRAPEQLCLWTMGVPSFCRCSWPSWHHLPAWLAARPWSFQASHMRDMEVRPFFCQALSFHEAGRAPQGHGTSPQDSVQCSAWDSRTTTFSLCICNGSNDITTSKTQGGFTRETQILHSQEKAPWENQVWNQWKIEL